MARHSGRGRSLHGRLSRLHRRAYHYKSLVRVGRMLGDEWTATLVLDGVFTTRQGIDRLVRMGRLLPQGGARHDFLGSREHGLVDSRLLAHLWLLGATDIGNPSHGSRLFASFCALAVLNSF